MLVIEGRNVNPLYHKGMRYLKQLSFREPSRAGDVLVMSTPVTSVYQRPTERVLFDTTRNANPFFHLYEGLWMLAGRNEFKSLNMYIRDFGARFGEKTDDIHGAYGHRWRNHFGFDQIERIISKFQVSPEDRQCVLQMWDTTPLMTAAEDHAEIYYEGADDLRGDWKDRPCNTQIYFRWRSRTMLDMTILCRSNDIIWGAYGANAVHFSMLHEYMAGRLHTRVGTMYQVSNNYHGYANVVAQMGTPSDHDPYAAGDVSAHPMGTDWDAWDNDLVTFMHWHDQLVSGNTPKLNEYSRYANAWFVEVAEPMALAYWKQKHAEKLTARSLVRSVVASDWRQAGLEWIERRKQA